VGEPLNETAGITPYPTGGGDDDDVREGNAAHTWGLLHARIRAGFGTLPVGSTQTLI
jgi:hypothetical protein